MFASRRKANRDEWTTAWEERYALRQRAIATGRGGRRLVRHFRHGRLAVVGLAASALAVPTIVFAAGEGRPLSIGERNPGSGGSSKETAVVANVDNSGLVLRPSNTAKGGRAISATCDNDGAEAEDGCAVYVNKGTGAAASFRTAGQVPFALRSTNNGLVRHLNADMIDGKHASELEGAQGPAGPAGPTGPEGPRGTAAAFARVASNGTLQPDAAGFPSQVKGIDSGDVVKGEAGASTGNYCFGGMDVQPASAVVSLDNADAGAADRNLVTSVAIDRGQDLGDCPDTHNQARVRIVDGNSEAAQDARFFILFEGG